MTLQRTYINSYKYVYPMCRVYNILSRKKKTYVALDPLQATISKQFIQHTIKNCQDDLLHVTTPKENL